MSIYNQVNRPVLRPPVEPALRAAIRVCDQPGLWSAQPIGHLECVEDQVGSEVGRELPAENIRLWQSRMKAR
jgi:hypothetical protein